MGTRLGEREILLGALPRCAAPGHVATWTRPTMTVLRITFGDQLSLDLSAPDELGPARDVVLMMEVKGKGFELALQPSAREGAVVRRASTELLWRW